jgi:hypothetical protein
MSKRIQRHTRLEWKHTNTTLGLKVSKISRIYRLEGAHSHGLSFELKARYLVFGKNHAASLGARLTVHIVSKKKSVQLGNVSCGSST